MLEHLVDALLTVKYNGVKELHIWDLCLTQKALTILVSRINENFLAGLRTTEHLKILILNLVHLGRISSKIILPHSSIGADKLRAQRLWFTNVWKFCQRMQKLNRAYIGSH